MKYFNTSQEALVGFINRQPLGASFAIRDSASKNTPLFSNDIGIRASKPVQFAALRDSLVFATIRKKLETNDRKSKKMLRRDS